MSFDISKIWLGTRDSYQSVMKMQDKLADGTIHTLLKENPKLDPQAYWDGEDDEDETPFRIGASHIQFANNVAIITVSGALVPNYAWYNSWFGLVSYEEIRDAFELALEAKENGTVNKIVMSVTSGGGAVQGIEDISKFIKFVDEKHLPVYAHVASHAYSAGYWLASSARHISVNKMGSVGSIGVIMTLVNYKGAYDKAGVEFHYLRSGKFKALGQTGEEFSDEMREHFMETVMTLHGFFEEHVISSRNGAASTREKWNQGKTFFAGEGIKLNLADEIMSFDTRVAKLIQSGNNRVVISENNSLSFEEAIMKFKFTEEQKAKLASGVPLEQLGLSEEDLAKAKAALSAETSEEPNAEEEAEGSSVDAEGSENVDAEQDSEESVDASEEDSKSVSAELATILASNKDLNKQLAKAEVKLEAAEEQVSQLTAESNDKSATIASLVKIAAEATSRLHISLGKATTDFSKLSAEDVMTAYADAQKDFEKTFPTGTQSAVNAESRKDQESLQQPRNTINPVE